MRNERSESSIAALACERDLAAALASALDGVGPSRVLVGVRCGGESAFAGSDGSSRAAQLAMPVGCLAKLLTSILALRLLRAAHVAVDARLVDLLDDARPHPSLSAVTVRQLLEHTHGLDSSLVEAPALRDGRIDAADLVRRASAERPLAPAGALYSYGNVGAWLLAAVLERLTARPYHVLLRDELLAPLGVDSSAARDSSPICAAAGGGLSLSVADWLSFLPFGSRALAAERAPVTSLPGWNPLERGICLGWKHHGARWFGHQSAWPGSSGFVRADAERGIELAVLSRDHAASLVAARIFGRALPELFDLRVPRPLPAIDPADLEASAGRYACAALRAEVSRRGPALELRIDDRVRDAHTRAELLPAARGIFLTRPAIDGFPYVQAIAGPRADTRYLWNGRFVLRRL